MFSRLLRLSAREWSYLAIAVFELLRARLRFAAVPTDQLLSALKGRAAASSLGAPGSGARDTLAGIAWAIAAAASRVPWRADCLVQALAADRWLRRRGFEPEFFLGVTKGDCGELRAHAWICCEGVTVTAAGDDAFIPLIEPQRKS